MHLKLGIRISLFGTAIETVGIVLDILHHLNIGIETPEGLLTANHGIILVGFLVNFVGVLTTLLAVQKKRA